MGAPAGSLDLNATELTVTDAQTLFNNVGTVTAVDAKALLEVRSTTQAFLLPRFNSTQFTAYDATSTTDGMLLYNTSTDTLKLRANNTWVDLLDSVNSVITASNGLTKTGNDIALGGTLTQNTNINNDGAYLLSLSGNRSSYMFTVTNSGTSNTDSGVKFVAGGLGLLAQSTQGELAGQFDTENTTTNSALSALQLNRNVTSGSGANSIGVKLTFGLETSTTASTISNNIVSQWTDATHATRSSKLSITSVNSGTESNSLEIASSGALRLNKYGTGTFTGTATKTLQVDASGNIIEGVLNPSSTGGIYGGSGVIGAGVAASATLATLPVGGSFAFKYNVGGNAIAISDNSQVQIFGPLGGSEFTAAATDISMIAGSNSISIGSTNNVIGGRTILSGPGGSGALDPSALLDLDSPSKILYVPRITTANQTALGAANNGGFHYNADTNKFTFRQGGAWVELNTVAAGSGGIYGGSGTIAPLCAATITAASSFRVKFAGGNNAINIDDTAGTILLAFKTTSGNPASGIQVNSGSLFFYTGATVQNSLTIDKTTAKSTFNNSTLYVNTVNGTGTAGQNSGLELDATDKVFYPPRITTTQRDAIATAGVDNGAMLYNSTTGKFTGRQGGAWVEFGTGAGTVTGSATTGQIAYWTSTTSIGGSSNIFFDTTNTRVGIGTSSPATLLHVAGHGRFDGAVLSRGSGANSSDSSSSVRLTNTSGATWYMTSKDDTGLDIQSSALGTIIGIAPTNGMVTTSASVAYPIVQTPASISATQNNYTVDNGVYAMRVNPTASLAITGFATSAGSHVGGRRFVFYNIDASNTFIITFKHQDAGSIAGNRIITSNGGDVTCRGGGSVVFWYDATDSRWRVESAS